MDWMAFTSCQFNQSSQENTLLNREPHLCVSHDQICHRGDNLPRIHKLLAQDLLKSSGFRAQAPLNVHKHQLMDHGPLKRSFSWNGKYSFSLLMSVLFEKNLLAGDSCTVSMSVDIFEVGSLWTLVQLKISFSFDLFGQQGSSCTTVACKY